MKPSISKTSGTYPDTDFHWFLQFLFLCYLVNDIVKLIFNINPDEFNTDFTIIKLGQANTFDFQFIE